MEKIKLSRLNQKKGTVPHVKELGKMMVKGYVEAIALFKTTLM